MTAQIHLRRKSFHDHIERSGWDRDTVAANIGVTPRTLYRITKGDNLPSNEFVAGALHAFHVPFPDLFEVVPA